MNNNNNRNNNIKTITDTQGSDDVIKAQAVPKQIAQSIIEKFEAEKNQYVDPIKEVEKGNFLAGSLRNATGYNDSIRRGPNGQFIEVHGNSDHKTIMTKFVEKDGAVAHEIMSSPTPPSVDNREDYYDEFSHLHGTEEGENGELPIIRASAPTNTGNNLSQESNDSPNADVISESNDANHSTITNQGEPNISNQTSSVSNNTGDSSKKTGDSDKKSETDKDDDSSDKGNGDSGLGGTDNNNVSSESGSAGPSNFRSYCNDLLIVIPSYIFSIISEIFEFFTFM